MACEVSNAIGPVKAINACRMAMQESGEHKGDPHLPLTPHLGTPISRRSPYMFSLYKDADGGSS
jgi:hypothetical protein